MWRQGSWDTIFDTFCFFIYFSSERYELDRFLLRSPNKHTVANSTDTRTSEKQSGSNENGITERAKRKEEGKWKYLCKSRRYPILCPLLQPPILYIILQQNTFRRADQSDRKHSCKGSLCHTEVTNTEKKIKRNHFHDDAVNSQCLQVFSWMSLLLLYRFYNVFFFFSLWIATIFDQTIW